MNENESSGLKSKIINFLKSDSKLLPFFLLCFFGMIFAIYFFIFNNSNISSENIVRQNNNLSKNDLDKENLTKAESPEVIFKSYENKAFPVILPNVLSRYTLKSNFTIYEVLSFAQKFGLKEYKPGENENEMVLAYSLGENKGILEFNKNSGFFTYQSFGSVKPKNYFKGQSATREAESFIKEIGFDETVKCTNTYQRKDLPENITYVECHRNWDRLDSPIVNLGGVLNLPETQKISSISVGQTEISGPADESIINVKVVDTKGVLHEIPNSNRKARPNDFNTATLAIDSNGRIISMVSNLRFIDKRIEVSRSKLLGLEEVLNILQNDKAEYSLTIPAGSGAIDWEKVYNQNKVSASLAKITDISVVYLDKPFDVAQAEYSPSFLIRGIAALDNGYNVRFVQALPAIKSELATDTTAVAGEKIEITGTAGNNLQLGTFKPIIDKLSITPAVPTTIPSSEMQSCESDKGSLEINLDVPGYGALTVLRSKRTNVESAHTFFYKSSSFVNKSREGIMNALYQATEEQYVRNLGHYLNKNPNTGINSVDDVYKLYNVINSENDYKNYKYAEFPAPFLNPKNPTYNHTAANNIYHNVARRILDYKQNNRIGDLIQGKELFPPETIIGLEGILYDISRNPMVPLSPCYISGLSPVIYLYPTKTMNVSVKTNSPLTYTDPSVSENSWKVIANPNGTVEQDKIQRQSLYYEYDGSKVSFTEPSEGFVVEYDGWKEFIRNDLSKKLGLNSKETESLIIEINNTLFNIEKTPYLKLSLISQVELDQKLPLSINPTPDNLYRINVFVTSLNQKLIIKKPRLNRVNRTGLTMVEIGAYIKQL